jgi:hypothetical protein
MTPTPGQGQGLILSGMKSIRTLIVVSLFAAGSAGQSAVPPFDELATHYSYDRQPRMALRESGVEKRDSIMVISMDYAGGTGRVPAYLLLPPGKGPFPAVLWGHWLKKNSLLNNRDDFLEEAMVLARAGVVSLLVDAPQARHELEVVTDPLEIIKQTGEVTAQQVIDLRHGVDLLLTRRGVDPHRIAYVGHGFDAHAGAILASVEHRISSFVLMASGYSDEDETFASKDPQVLAARKRIGDDNLRAYFHDFPWDNPVHFLSHTDGENIFLQFGSQDSISREQAQRYLEMFSAKDKKMEFYDAGSALNAAARVDRARWLEKHLGLKHIDQPALERIPQLK